MSKASEVLAAHKVMQEKIPGPPKVGMIVRSKEFKEDGEIVTITKGNVTVKYKSGDTAVWSVKDFWSVYTYVKG